MLNDAQVISLHGRYVAKAETRRANIKAAAEVILLEIRANLDDICCIGGINVPVLLHALADEWEQERAHG
jgi:hypothetical protein